MVHLLHRLYGVDAPDCQAANKNMKRDTKHGVQLVLITKLHV